MNWEEKKMYKKGSFLRLLQNAIIDIKYNG